MYKLIGNNDSSNVVGTILNNRGINDVDRYLHLTENDIENYNDLDNIDEAIECFNNHFERKSKIGILVDTDPDGVCSATIMFNYIRYLDCEYPVYLIIHKSNKAHGLQSKDFDIEDDTKLIICPDSSTNDIDECQQLIESGIEVIIADHHAKSDNRENPAIVLNNQTSNRYYNKHACGAHITWDFIRALDDYYWTDYSDSCLDLVALANISDNMNITSISTRATINIGLSNIKNKMFNSIIESQEFSMKGISTPHTVSFSVTPLINAFLRLATYEERQLLMKAFCGIDDEVFEYTKRGEVFPIEENIYDHIVRLFKSYKGKQDRMRDKAIKVLIEMTVPQNDNKVVILDSTDIVESALNGLVAIKISEKINKPVLIGKRLNDGSFAGSGRNFDDSPVDSLRELVEMCPYVTFAQGHDSAFGMNMPEDNIRSAIEWFNTELSNIDMTKVYLCDFIFNADEIDAGFIKDIDDIKWLFGTGLKDPKIIIKNICARKDEISIYGKNLDTISFETNGIKFVQFKASNGDLLYDYINSWEETEEEIIFDAIVECELNEYKGVITPQCKIIDCEVDEY